MSSFCKVTACNQPGGTGANANYILRERACERWDTQNIPDYKILGNTVLERKQAAVEELSHVSEMGTGKRHSFRVVLSFERNVSHDRALEMAREFLAKSPFKNNPAIMAVHTNTNHTHVHINLAARKTDGKKIQLDNQQYRSIDKTWERIYTREMTREIKQEQPQLRTIEQQHNPALSGVNGRVIQLEEWRRRYGQLRREGSNRRRSRN